MTDTQVEAHLTCVDGLRMGRFAHRCGAPVARRAHEDGGHKGPFELAILTPDDCSACGVPIAGGGLR